MTQSIRNHCPTCGENYSKLGNHFQWNPDHRPPLSPWQKDVIRHLTLLGVSVRDDTTHPRFEVYSDSEYFIQVTADALGWMANEPRLHESAESVAERFDNLTVDDVSGLWAVSTLPHPELADYREPEDVSELTPRVARWLIKSRGEWVGTVIGSLHIDVRGSTRVDGDHLMGLLRDIGVDDFCEDTRTDQGDITHQGHWDRDIVAIPHRWAMALLDYAGLEVGDIPWTREMFLTEPREEVAFEATISD